MGRLVDLTGKVFGTWTVIQFTSRDKIGHSIWLCRCICGTERSLFSSNLKSNSNCGCIRAPDLTGMVFGSWVVLERGENDKNGGRRWICRCRCGKEKLIHASGLKNGMTKSCGCSLDPSAEKNIELTQEYLRNILYYDPDTGTWTWLVRPDQNTSWNNQWAGKRAGCLDNQHGYWKITIDYRAYPAHVLAWFYMTGEWPENEIDHKNTDESDCRWSNLRQATRGQNSMNRGVSVRNKIGLKGVCWDTATKSWEMQINANGVCYRKKGFITPEAAHAHYIEKAIELHGEFARFS